jgi:tetratricopeptide (TPR) repeat protein
LGLTLYELATLEPAFANASTPEVIRAVTAASPTPPRKVDPQLPADLSTVIEKAIAKEPARRYQTAAELRDDLRAFVEDRPISARRTTMLGQFLRFSRRNPLAASLMGLLVLTLGLLTATAAVGYWATNSALNDLREKQISLQEEQVATQQALQLAESQFQRAETNVDVALEAFDQVFRQLISRGSGRSGDLDIDGFQQIAGIERAITEDDAQFVEELLEFYHRLAIDSDNDSENNRDFRTESATASRRIANIYRLVGENEKSLEAYTSAIKTFEELAEEQPESLNALLNAVAIRNERASLLGTLGKWREALADLVKSREQLTYHLESDDTEAKLPAYLGACGDDVFANGRG